MHEMWPTTVECYAGARYPDRPTAFDWNGRRISVDKVIDQWQCPGERHFRVDTVAGRFHLVYHQKEDSWHGKRL